MNSFVALFVVIDLCVACVFNDFGSFGVEKAYRIVIRMASEVVDSQKEKLPVHL